MKKILCPLWKNMKAGDKPAQPTGFYLTLEGDGVYENEVLYGSFVKLVFHIPETELLDSEISLDFSIIPCGFSLLKNARWTQTVEFPCKETEISFFLRAKDKEEKGENITAGFSFSINSMVLNFYQEFIAVRLVETNPKSFVKKIDFNFQEKINGIAERVQDWHEKLAKTEFVED